jgi:signal recognition particle receptor subunit beta
MPKAVDNLRSFNSKGQGTSRNMASFRVLIVGASNSGKTELVKTISEFPIISVEKKLYPSEDLIPMDYGRRNTSDHTFWFYAPAGNVDVATLWSSMSDQMERILLLVDGSAPTSIEDAKGVVAALHDAGTQPSVVLVNRAAASNTQFISDLRASIGISKSTPIQSGNVLEFSSLQNVLSLIADTSQ